MSRYVNDIRTSLSTEGVMRSASACLESHGFKRATRHDEGTWKKGGWLLSPRYVRITPSGNSVRLEAWVRWALLPGVIEFAEADPTTGRSNVLSRMELNELINELESLLQGGRAHDA